jgi:hypothetical protein
MFSTPFDCMQDFFEIWWWNPSFWLKSFDVLLLIPGEDTNINMIISGDGGEGSAGDSVDSSPEPEAGSFESLTWTKGRELKKTLTWTKGRELKTLTWIFQIHEI